MRDITALEEFDRLLRVTGEKLFRLADDLCGLSVERLVAALVVDSRRRLFQSLSDEIDSGVIETEFCGFRQTTAGLPHIACLDGRFSGGEQLLQALALALKLTLTGKRFECVGSDVASFRSKVVA